MDNFQERELIFPFFTNQLSALVSLVCWSLLNVSTWIYRMSAIQNRYESKMQETYKQRNDWFFFSVLFPVNFSLIKVIVSRLQHYLAYELITPRCFCWWKITSVEKNIFSSRSETYRHLQTQSVDLTSTYQLLQLVSNFNLSVTSTSVELPLNRKNLIKRANYRHKVYFRKQLFSFSTNC